MMEDPETTAEPKPSEALPSPEGKPMEGMQQVNPEGGYTNATVQASPSSTISRKPQSRVKQKFHRLWSWMKIGLMKMWILIWKNFMFRGRAWVLLIFQILIAINTGLLGALFGPPGATKSRPVNPSLPTEYLQREMITKFANEFGGSEFLIVEAGGLNVDPILNHIDTGVGAPGIRWTKVAESAIQKEFDDMFANKRTTGEFAAAVIFEKLEATQVRYTIRLVKNKGIQTSQSTTEEVHSKTGTLFLPVNPPGPNEEHEKAYYNAGFLGLQLLIDEGAVKMLHPGTEFKQKKVILKTFPYPKYYQLEKVDFPVYGVLCLCASFLFLISTAFLAKSVASEKETGVKELMKLSGYPGWMQYLAWYLVPLVVDSIIFAIVLIMYMTIPGIPGLKMNDKAPLTKSDFSLWMFIFILADISMSAFVFFCCSFTKSSSVATAVMLLLSVGICIGLSNAISRTPDSFSLYMSVSILPHGCMFTAFKYLFEYEAQTKGAQWSRIGEPFPGIPTMNLGYVILMFMVNTTIFHCAAVYLENILPSEYGVRKPAYYPIQPIIELAKRIRNRKKGANSTNSKIIGVVPSEANGFETYQGTNKVGVDVQNLVKKFDRHKVAVSGVSVRMYDGEIFALLGHNGAGKTTLISMLTGMFAPTSGTAKVCGYDIRTDMNHVRKNLGLCPQHDMLFNNLTVMQHLRIFGQMKGQSSAKVKQEAKDLLLLMRMTEKANTVSKKLSGGQKRKLCLAMALIGGAKVVILDEPTSGMDPEARRAIWDILLQIRGQRTIILTTHYMEEADVLGDRIGIMAEGKLQCCGSPSFLKSFYGTGYTLKVSVHPGGNKDAILSLVQSQIPDASLKPINLPNEVFISLPAETTTSSSLSSLFSALTAKKEEMKIESLGLSVASMEEIFLKVGELSGLAAVEATTKSPESKASVRPQAPEPTESATTHEQVVPVDPGAAEEGQAPTIAPAESKVLPSTTSSKPIPTKSKSKRFNFKILRSCLMRIVMQTLALIIKRFIGTKRKIWFLLFQTLVCILMPIWILSDAYRLLKVEKLSPALKMTLDKYDMPLTFYKVYQAPGLDQAIKKMIGSSAKTSSNIQVQLERSARQDIDSFREKMIVAGELTPTECEVWFNTIPLHAAPLAINLASNLRGQDLPTKMSFHVTNHPLKSPGAFLMQAALNSDRKAKALSQGISGLMLFALLILSVFFVILPTEERLNKSRQLQLMTGIHPLIYWIVYFLWDILLMLLMATVIVIVLLIGQPYGLYSTYSGAGVVFLIIAIYGYTIIPFAYLVSNIPKTVAGGIIIVLFFLLLPFLIALPLGPFAPKVAEWVTRLSPIVGVFQSLSYVGLMLGYNVKCNYLGESERRVICWPNLPPGSPVWGLRQCCDDCKRLPGVTCYKPKPFLPWSNPNPGEVGVGQSLLILFIISVVCQAIHLFIELGGLRFIRRKMIKANESEFTDTVNDQDVQEEKRRVADMIMSGSTGSDALVVDTLSKTYGPFAAVSKLTFGVHHGECYGLLGTNGAGKTTTFRIITGDELQSLGEIYEGKLTLSRNRRALISNIGYCPQFDAFIPYFTGKENLQLFARLRGIPWRQVSKEANKWLEKVGLTGSGNVKCKNYSGGMKRRLSAAIAMIGDPALVLLDEPTSGVDPVSRRQFWKVLESVKGSGKSIILTSHSMDECEALCARLGIMVNGQLQCIGGVQHLKHKFAQGYCLTIRLKPLPTTQEQAQPQVQQPQQQFQQQQPQQFQFQQVQHQQFQYQEVVQPQYSRQLQNPYLQQPQSQSQEQSGMFSNPQWFQPPPSYQQQQTFQQVVLNANSGQDLTRLHAELSEKFHPCLLKDQHETVLQYQIENTALGWDVIYKTLEDLKKSYEDIIEDYSVSETSLEEVFLAFSRAQYLPRRSQVPLCKRIMTCQF